MRYTHADLERVQLLVEEVMLRIEEQRNRIVWMASRGHDTAQAERLFEVMTQILQQLVARRGLIADALRHSRNGSA